MKKVEKKKTTDTYVETEADARIKHFIRDIKLDNDRTLIELKEEGKKHVDTVLEDIDHKYQMLQEGWTMHEEAEERRFLELKHEIANNRKFSDFHFKDVYKEINEIKKKLGSKKKTVHS